MQSRPLTLLLTCLGLSWLWVPRLPGVSARLSAPWIRQVGNLEIVEALEGAWPTKSWVLTTFQVLYDKKTTINMKAELQFAHGLMTEGL